MQKKSLKKRIILGIFRVTDNKDQLSVFLVIIHVILWFGVLIGATTIPYPFGGLAFPLFVAGCFGYFKANRSAHEGDGFTQAWEGSFEHKSHPETECADGKSNSFGKRWLRSFHQYDVMHSENFFLKDSDDE